MHITSGPTEYHANLGKKNVLSLLVGCVNVCLGCIMLVLVCKRMTGLYQWPFSFCGVSVDVPRRKNEFPGL